MTGHLDARTRLRRAAVLPMGAALALAAVAACGDDPFAIRWDADPDTVVLFSLARPELNLVSAYNFHIRLAFRVESATATGNWDVALDTRGNELVLLPPGALGIESRAGIARVDGLSFAGVTEAPSDTAAYSRADPVPVSLGTIYVIRTHQGLGVFGTRCVYYAKLEPLIIDVAGGTLTFVFDENPVCNDRSLVPPD